ncbi:MAG: hypothetical protein U1F83_06370 [Verrucomicrobiota bacterium]
MKRSNLLLACGCLLAVTQFVNANDASRTFEIITKENAFRLKPPTLEAQPPVAIVERPQITVQGFTTILGRTQVLLSIQKLKATETGGVACILSESENQNDVTVLEINVKAETVRLNNIGLEQILALKR